MTGPTHHGLFDISYLRSVPNLIHMVASSEDQLADMMYTAMLRQGPQRSVTPAARDRLLWSRISQVALEIGKAEVLEDGTDVAIFALGALLGEGKRLALMLEEQGLSVALIDPRFAKPIDRDAVGLYGKRCGLLVTLEDHVLAGGFGSAVLEAANELGLSMPVVRVGWPDEFIEHGKQDDLRRKYGVTAEGAMVKAESYVRMLVESRLVAR